LIKKEKWESLSIPKNALETYNKNKFDKGKAR
jgi:hypothetical protein